MNRGNGPLSTVQATSIIRAFLPYNRRQDTDMTRVGTEWESKSVWMPLSCLKYSAGLLAGQFRPADSYEKDICLEWLPWIIF